MSSPQKFIGVTDGEFKFATFEARTPEEKARELGAVIIGAYRRKEVWKSLSKQKAPISAMLLLYSMCFEYGRIEPGRAGLVVRTGIKLVAESVGLTSRSGYKLARDLRAAEILKVIAATSLNEPLAYEVVIPEEGMETLKLIEEARATGAWARAPEAKCPGSDSCTDRNYRTDNDLARAPVAKAPGSDTENCANVSFSTDSPPLHKMQGDRAPLFTIKNLNLIVNNTETLQVPDVPTDPGEVTGILIAMAVLPNTAVELASRPTSTLFNVLAARWQTLNHPLKDKPKFRPAGIIINILKEKDGSIDLVLTADAKRAACREIRKRCGLMPDPPSKQAIENQQFEELEKQVDQLIAADPAAVEVARARAIEGKRTAGVLDARSEARLKTCDPRMSHPIRCELRKMLSDQSSVPSCLSASVP